MRRVWWLWTGGLLALLAAAPGALAGGVDADRVLAASCRGCHGQAATERIPALSGRGAAELEALLLAYKRDERAGTLMNRLAKGYSDAELARIAAVFGAAESAP